MFLENPVMVIVRLTGGKHYKKLLGNPSFLFLLIVLGAGKYGLGFKLAASRLAHNCLVLTKTASSYGVGLFSAMLNAMFCTSDFVCPTAVWSASTGALIPYPLEEAEFGQNLRLILSRSPLETFSALEEELQWFGSGTGTMLEHFALDMSSGANTRA